MLEDISLKLLMGRTIDIHGFKIHPLKIEEITDIGEQLYNQYLGVLLYDIDLIENISKENLKDLGIDKFTTYHFLILNAYNNADFKQLVIDSFEMFLKEKVGFHDETAIFYVERNNHAEPITLEFYELFRKIIIKQNFLKELEEEENLLFGNDLAREWYLEMKRKEKNMPKPKSNVDLQSIISAVMWKSGKSIEEILKMTIYQLYDGYYRLSTIDDCVNLTQGIYSGNIDQKSVKQSELNWAKIIKFDKNQ